MSKNGKYNFYVRMLEDELITKEEFKLLLWYEKNVKSKLDKDVK